MFSQDTVNKIKDINTEGENTTGLMPLDDIDYDKQYRQDIENYDLEWLASNIYELSISDEKYPVGLHNRVVISKQENGRWLMDDGEMRHRAFCLLRKQYPNDDRWKSIPFNEASINVTKRSERDKRQLSANILSDDGTVFDQARGIVSVIEAEGVEAVKKILSSSKNKKYATSNTAMSRWKKIAKAPQDVINDSLDLNIKDKTLIALLSDIFNKNKGRYFQLIIDYKADLIDKSLYKAAQELWQFLTKFKETPSLIEQHKKQVEESENNNSNSNIADFDNTSTDNENENSVSNELKESINDSQNENNSSGIITAEKNQPESKPDDSKTKISRQFVAKEIQVLSNGMIRFTGEEGMLNITLPNNIKLDIVNDESESA